MTQVHSRAQALWRDCLVGRLVLVGAASLVFGLTIRIARCRKCSQKFLLLAHLKFLLFSLSFFIGSEVGWVTRLNYLTDHLNILEALLQSYAPLSEQITNDLKIVHAKYILEEGAL